MPLIVLFLFVPERKISNSFMYDCLIIGGGPAGLSAGLYLARQKLKFAIIAKEFAGQVAWSYEIGNYLGFPDSTGAEMAQKFHEHIKQYKVEVKEGEEVKNIRQKGKNFTVETGRAKYETKTIIIATGERPRKLGIPGEEEFYGKGVAYCATCDAPLFKDKSVAVIGGANSAMEAALTCNQYSRPVYVLTINKDLEGERSLINKVKSEGGIKIIGNAKAKEIVGNEFVTGLKYEAGGKDKELKVNGVFVEIGMQPNSEFITLVQKNERGEIIINGENMSGISGLFAAGDVTNVTSKQIIIATGEGAKAALGVIRYLQRKS